MKRILSTAFVLLALAAWPLAAQEGGAGAPGAAGEGAGEAGGGVNPSPADTGLTVQRENAADTEVPSVRGAETTPDANVAGTPTGQTGQAAVAGDVETEDETTGLGGDEEGGAMPRTASSLPILIGLGAALAVAGLALRVGRSR